MVGTDVIDQAKIIIFPFNEEFIPVDSFFCRQDNCIMLTATLDERYPADTINHHHFYTWWHRSNVYPALEQLLHFGYNEDDFHIIKDGDADFMVPKVNTQYRISSFLKSDFKDDGSFTMFEHSCLYNAHEITGVSEIFNSDYHEKIADDKYHQLFKYPHECVKIERVGGNSGRNLLISGDSHMIPSIPILAYYFDTIVYLDGRYNSPLHLLYEGVEFTDYLFAVWNGYTYKKYMETNFSYGK